MARLQHILAAHIRLKLKRKDYNTHQQGYIFVSDDSATMSSVHMAFARKSASTTASTLRLAALESTSKHHDQEILKDLFWTIYSKLDAVTQGLRVVFEVANRIGSVSDLDLHQI